MIKGKPSTFPTSAYNSFKADPGSHFAPSKMMMIEDEAQEEYKIFCLMYDHMVEMKSFLTHDNNFNSKEMEHHMHSIFRNHKWDIRFIDDEWLDILAKEYITFQSTIHFSSQPIIHTISSKSHTLTLTPVKPAQAPPTPLSQTNPILTEEWKTVKKPVSYAKATKGKGKQTNGKDKPNNLIQTTLLMTTLTNSAASKLKPKPKPSTPDALKTTNYIVILDHSSPQTHLYRTEQTSYTIHLQEALKHTEASIHLLTGRWSNPTSTQRNFILCFKGKLSFTDISKYNKILFDPFGGDICRGVPSVGYV
jgi:hypothetical protein